MSSSIKAPPGFALDDGAAVAAGRSLGDTGRTLTWRGGNIPVGE